VAEAFFWGGLAASTLLLGALLAYWFNPGPKLIGAVMAVGSGLLLGSISFELIDEALKTQTIAWVGLLLFVGAGVFTLGDWIIARRGGSDRKDPSGGQADGSPLAIVLGSILDGIPESFVLGLTVIQGGVSVGLLFGVGLSNIPEGMASSSGLDAAGWPRRKVVLMWVAVALVSAVSAALGYVLLDPDSARTGALVQSFAAGSLLAMLANTMLPEAYELDGIVSGPLVVTGFAASIALSAL
jgi:ZIP family zinc transporter